MITQVFILGSSSAYGVGALGAGWGDLVKQYIHSKMYGENGVGEKYEVYNFGKSGCTIDFVKATFPGQLKEYGRKHKTIVVVAVGGNNAKAEDSPDNFVSTPEAYKQEMEELLVMLKSSSDAVVALGNGFIDESKTSPKPNPLKSGNDYMTNVRRQQFSGITKRICKTLGIDFAEVVVGEQEWLEKYLYTDGLHPNQQGHQLIFESIKPFIPTAIPRP